MNPFTAKDLEAADLLTFRPWPGSMTTARCAPAACHVRSVPALYRT